MVRSVEPSIDAVTTDPRTSLCDHLLHFICAEVASDVGPELDADSDLVMSGIVDSLGVVMIVEDLERRLGIRIDPVDVVIEHFSSVSAILDYLERRDDVDVVTLR